jgi:tetratricopeptide (TPR) repeat protein
VPIYAGTYLWHLNLALCGYAVLLGVAVSRFLGSLPSAAVRRFGLIGFCGSLLLLGKVNFDACLTRGVHRLAYMLNTTEVITHPPVPAERLGQKPLIYIEDRLGLGRWNYGSSYLFSFAYLNLEIEQVTVPPLAQMPGELIGNWFQRKNAFFFRYDDQFKWRDATAEFASHTIGRLTQYTNELFAKGRGKEVPAILAPVMDRLANDGIARYHYALGLQMQGKTEEALKEYATAERIMPRFFFIFFNRGRMFADLHRNKEACGDYKRAVSLDGSNVTAAQMVRETCH